jgi:hypothetical protein
MEMTRRQMMKLLAAAAPGIYLPNALAQTNASSRPNDFAYGLKITPQV